MRKNKLVRMKSCDLCWETVNTWALWDSPEMDETEMTACDQTELQHSYNVSRKPTKQVNYFTTTESR